MGMSSAGPASGPFWGQSLQSSKPHCGWSPRRPPCSSPAQWQRCGFLAVLDCRSPACRTLPNPGSHEMRTHLWLGPSWSLLSRCGPVTGPRAWSPGQLSVWPPRSSFCLGWPVFPAVARVASWCRAHPSSSRAPAASHPTRRKPMVAPVGQSEAAALWPLPLAWGSCGSPAPASLLLAVRGTPKWTCPPGTWHLLCSCLRATGLALSCPSGLCSASPDQKDLAWPSHSPPSCAAGSLPCTPLGVPVSSAPPAGMGPLQAGGPACSPARALGPGGRHRVRPFTWPSWVTGI